MADTAFQTKYRKETIAAFEVQESLLRKSVTTEAEVDGNTAVFLVAGSGGATATTRGTNGLIPARADDNTQLSCTLAEWHDLARKTRFNIFASQGSQVSLMQRTTVGVINRKIDADIIAALETGTQDTGTAAEASLDMFMYAKTILGNAEVPMDGNISCAITPAAHAFLMQTREFASVDYVNNKPFENAPVMFRWAGLNFIVHPNLTGVGTSAEKLLMYHRDAIGHAMDMERLDTFVGYDGEHDYSYARCTGFFGSKLLQNTGIVVINHDGSRYAAQ